MLEKKDHAQFFLVLKIAITRFRAVAKIGINKLILLCYIINKYTILTM